jgi:glucosamine-6-phosphate deaminase
LRQRYAAALDWGRVHIVQMDEYAGLGMGDPRSLAHCIFGELVAPLRAGGFSHFNDAAGRLIRPLAQYEAALERIDLVVHGIGRNGHIGFNEPGSAVDSGCRVVRLAGSTLRANRVDARDGVTLGLKSLLAARATLLLATGHEKAAALGRALSGPPSDRCPASRLRGCRNVVVLADALAASRVGVPRGASERTYRKARGEAFGALSTGISVLQRTSNNRLI